jgi:hypothetical protein
MPDEIEKLLARARGRWRARCRDLAGGNGFAGKNPGSALRISRQGQRSQVSYSVEKSKNIAREIAAASRTVARTLSSVAEFGSPRKIPQAIDRGIPNRNYSRRCAATLRFLT